MAREMPYRVIVPFGYAAAKDARYPVIYLLHGLAGHFDNWTELTKIEEYSAACGCIVVTPEGGDGWYTDSGSKPADKFESYIVRELVPAIDKGYRTLADRKHRVIAGLSMGGYGAVKFGLKYPEMFVLAGSFSGAFDSPLRGQEHPFLRPSILSVFGADDSEVRKTNDIFRLVREMPAGKVNALPFFYFDCGTEDFLFKPNREFADLLVEKKIAHEFRQLPGKHEWKYWDTQVQEFIELTEKYFSGPIAKL